MATNMKNNEKRILNKHQELKDSIFGLYQPFFKRCYKYSPRQGYQYDAKEADSLIESILEHCDKEEDLFYSIMRDFLDISFKFIFVACNSDDWRYISLLKLSETIEKPNADWVSTMDVMVDDEQENLKHAFGEEFNEVYHRLINVIIGKELSDFPQYVKKSVEKHIDANGLNSLDDDELTNEVLSLMDDLSRKVKRMYSNKIRGRRE